MTHANEDDVLGDHFPHTISKHGKRPNQQCATVVYRSTTVFPIDPDRKGWGWEMGGGRGSALIDPFSLGI